MAQRPEEFLRRLQAAFTAEAAEHCEVLSAGLLQLEAAPPAEKRKLIDRMFRSAHSLKGAARAVSLSEVEAMCQRLESVFAGWQRQAPAPGAGAFDTLHRAVDLISGLSRDPGVALPPECEAAVVALLADLARVEAGGIEPAAALTGRAVKPTALVGQQPVPPAAMPAVAPAPSGEPTAPDPTVRVPTERVERVLYGTEELLGVKSALRERGRELRELVALADAGEGEWIMAAATVRALRRRLANTPGAAALPRELSAVVESLERGSAGYNALTEKLGAIGRTLERDGTTAAKMIDGVLEETKDLLLVPFAIDAAYFSKLVRDLARDQGKQVEFVFRGGDVEIDKRVLQEMKAPLVHLLRNCIDHGMEPPQQRTRAGKPARGTVVLAATQLEDHKVEITVEDDGAGIDLGAVRQAARKRRLVTDAALAQLSERELLQLIFQPEFTTAPIVTEVSGRGLGLAIVSEQVEKLGGRVEVDTAPNRGTTFRLIVPVAQTTFRGVLVSVAERHFVIPAMRIERVLRTARTDIKTVENRETIIVSDRATSFVWLADALELPRAPAGNGSALVESLVLGRAENRVAFAVDAILREEEVLVKPLRTPLRRVRNVAGATVLGSGEVVPILNAADLLASAASVGGRPATAPGGPAKSALRQRSILLAEDSITSRMLLKNILESAGYAVQTAVDGLEALTTLRTQPFDLVVSDVEMPRLNGFALTAAIRADRKLADVPVILVTALATREDRERGIDAGANAYLVKSDFDQSNLLAAVRRLVSP